MMGSLSQYYVTPGAASTTAAPDGYGTDTTTSNASSALNGGAGWQGYGTSGSLFASGSDGASFAANPQDYANNINNDNAAAQQYYNQGASFNQAAPQAHDATQGQSQRQLSNTYNQQGQLANQLQGIVNNPNSSQAVQQFNMGANQAQQATTALANSAGGGVAGAGARRQAQQTNGVASAQNVAAQQQVAAQAQQAAQGQLSSLYGQQGQLANSQLSSENQYAQQQAALTQGQMALNEGTSNALYGLSANEQGLTTGALTGYSNDLLGEAGASNSAQQVSNAFGNQIIGSGLSAAGTAYSGLSKAYQNQQNGGS